MKLIYLLFFLFSLIMIGCNPVRQKILKQNSEKEEKAGELLKWYNKLVTVKPLPTYVFETEFFNKKSIANPDFDYVLIDPSWCFDEETCILQLDQNLIDKARDYMIKAYGEKYDSLFLQPELKKAYNFLDSKKLKYERVVFQVPVQTGSADIDSILQASYGLFPKMPSTMPEDQFMKIFKMSYEDYDRSNRINDYYRLKREWVKQLIFKRHYAQSFENISELVESDRFNPDFKVSDLPAPLIDSLMQRFEYLKTLLPNSEKEKVSDSKLFVGYLSQPFLAPKLYLQNFNKDVYISPLLIRASLIGGLSEIFEHIKTTEGFENPNLFSVLLVENYSTMVGKIRKKRTRSRTSFLAMEMDIFYPSIQERWKTQFDFVILHEIAHVINDKFTEEECDCFAINILKKNFSAVELGVFSNLVYTYKNDYWDRSNDKTTRGNLTNRYRNANKIIERPGIVDCQKIKK